MSEAAAVDRLPWDSEFFGFGVARVRDGPLGTAEARQVVEWCRRESVRCVYFLAPAADTASWRAAIGAGFLPVDFRMEFARKLSAEEAAMPQTEKARLACQDDAELLVSMSKNCFLDSRFYRDPKFPRSRVDAMFSLWIRRCVSEPGRFTFLAERAGEPAGFLGGSVVPEVGRIELVAVSPRYRGQGIARDLLAASRHEFARRGAHHLRVVTQGSNIAAQRIYENGGFRTFACGLWFHRWLP